MDMVLLWTDCLFFICLLALAFILFRAYHNPINKKKLKRILATPVAMTALIILSVYLSIAVLDSIHFQKLDASKGQLTQTQSVLDSILYKRAYSYEKTYSAPFSFNSFIKETHENGGQYYPPLKFVDKSIKSPLFVLKMVAKSALIALFITFIFLNMHAFGYYRKQYSLISAYKKAFNYHYLTFIFILFLLILGFNLQQYIHIFGTGKIGEDIFYYGLKSIRTGLLIGSLTTLFMLPLALLLGTSAGLIGGKTDDVIQYIYITLSSIPGVLLIAASVLSLQVFISNHTELFPTLIERADARLLALCFILGITSWTSLCRMLRAETLKLREMEYVQAAYALGSTKFKILLRHIMPNVMHIVVIALVLDFSFLVLAEAVLSYIGVGVSPMTISWGNMINSARLELAREPIVWWPILCAFIMMFILVLSVNLLSDVVRDVFDPRAQTE